MPDDMDRPSGPERPLLGKDPGAVPTTGALQFAREFLADAAATPTVVPAGAPATGAQAPPLPPERYSLLDVLGQGGMGVVYRARDHVLGREVAVKVLRGTDLVPDEVVERFQREARAAAALDHPNIVRVLDVGRLPNGSPFYSMDLLAGEDLAHRIVEGSLRAREAVEAVRQVSLALLHAHQKGVLHRDIKPQNVFLREEPTIAPPDLPTVRGDRRGLPPEAAQPRRGVHALLLDFGLAKLAEHDLAEHGQNSRSRRSVQALTQSGQIMGTPAYMSPEQTLGAREVDTRADIYGLGATLYHALAGRPPFDAPSLVELLVEVQRGDAAPPSRSNADIDADLDTLTLKCLQKDPKDRYQDAGDLAEDLKRWLAGEPISARPIGLVGRVWRKAKRNKAVAIPVALAVIFFAATWAVFLLERSASEKGAALVRENVILQLVKQAEALSRERDLASVRKAVETCDRALEGVPADDMRATLAQAAFLRGLSHRRLIQIDAARADFKMAFDLDPLRNDARHEAALLDFETGDIKGAEELLAAIAKEASKGSVLSLMAKARLAQIRSRKRETSPQQAADCHAEIDHDLEEVQKKDPLFADQYFFRASLVGYWAGYGGGLPQPPTRQPDLGFAVNCLEQGLIVEPLSLPARLSRGDNLRRLELYQEAMRDFEAARNLAPEDVRVYYLHARTASALRLYDFALSDLQQALRIKKQDELLVYRGFLRICLGDNHAALGDAREAFALRPSKAENAFFLAVCLSLADEERESKELARKWADAKSPLFQLFARTDAAMEGNPTIAHYFTSMLNAVDRGVNDYFGVDPAVKKMTYYFMRDLVARRRPTEATTIGLKETMDQLGKPNDLMPPEIEDILLRAEELDPRQQEMLRATNHVLEAAQIRTPLQTLLQITRFTIKYYDLLALADRPTVTDPQELYRRGCFRYYNGERDDLLAAREDFRKALESRPAYPEALYGFAAVSARLAFTDDAIDALRRLKRTHFARWQDLAEDPDLVRIKNSSEFKELMKD